MSEGYYMVEKFCSKCGIQNPDGAAFCQECGEELNKVILNEPQEITKLKEGKHQVLQGIISVYPEGIKLENELNEKTKLPWNQIIDVKYSRFPNAIIITMSDNEKYRFTCKREIAKGIYLLTKQKMSGTIQEIGQRKLLSDLEKRKMKFLDGRAKMIIELPSTGYSGGARATATLALGIIGYAATKGGKTKQYKIIVKVAEDKLKISGQISTEIKISDIENTMFQDNPPILTLNFKNGSSINLRRQGARRTYPSILNGMIKERMKKVLKEKLISGADRTSYMDEIKKAKELFDMDVISEEEFEEIKNKYLKQLN